MVLQRTRSGKPSQKCRVDLSEIIFFVWYTSALHSFVYSGIGIFAVVLADPTSAYCKRGGTEILASRLGPRSFPTLFGRW